MTSGHYGPYVQGVRGDTMVGTMGSEAVRWSESRESLPCADCSLELDCMKLESLVMAGQPHRRE